MAAVTPQPSPVRARPSRPIAGPEMRIARHLEQRGTASMTAEVLASVQDLRPRILEIVRGEVDGVRYGDIKRRLGGISQSKLQTALGALIADRQLASIVRLKETRYRQPLAGEDLIPGPPVRSIPVPPFDRDQLREAVASALDSGRTWDLNELVTQARVTTVHASRHTVEQALRELVSAGRVRQVWSGVFARYQAVVPA